MSTESRDERAYVHAWEATGGEWGSRWCERCLVVHHPGTGGLPAVYLIPGKEGRIFVEPPCVPRDEYAHAWSRIGGVQGDAQQCEHCRTIRRPGGRYWPATYLTPGKGGRSFVDPPCVPPGG